MATVENMLHKLNVQRPFVSLIGVSTKLNSLGGGAVLRRTPLVEDVKLKTHVMEFLSLPPWKCLNILTISSDFPLNSPDIFDQSEVGDLNNRVYNILAPFFPNLTLKWRPSDWGLHVSTRAFKAAQCPHFPLKVHPSSQIWKLSFTVSPPSDVCVTDIKQNIKCMLVFWIRSVQNAGFTAALDCFHDATLTLCLFESINEFFVFLRLRSCESQPAPALPFPFFPHSWPCCSLHHPFKLIFRST